MSKVLLPPRAWGAVTPDNRFLLVRAAHFGQVANRSIKGRSPIRHAIFDAFEFKSQLDFAKPLCGSGVALILGTKAAELAVLSRYQGRPPTGTPWPGCVRRLPGKP
jgi:hypothetical protein